MERALPRGGFCGDSLRVKRVSILLAARSLSSPDSNDWQHARTRELTPGVDLGAFRHISI
jgi:hypothetical protein